ncbi:MFS transporter [uncultured Dialister sp.]|uniref:MFS transporter n=1 Tax=uncultured Dialister sp. TaxID=278064 RepID=UPI002638A494|nr:MFS transporter [uncultured Dialister sp.]
MNPSVYFFALGHLATDWSQGAIPALLPYFIAHYGLSYQQAGMLVFANVLIASVMQPVFGYYSDRISRPWFISLGCLICGLSISSVGFTGSYMALFTAALCCGVGSALFHPEAALMVNRISGEAKGRAMGIFSVGGNAGFAIGPLLAGLCAYSLGIQSLLIFGVLNALIALSIFLRMPSVLRIISLAEKKKSLAHGKEEKTNDWWSFGKLSVLILARSLGFTLSNTFIPLLWIHVMGASEGEGTSALSILFGLGACFTYLGGVLADTAGFLKVIRTAFICMVPAYFFLTHTDSLLFAYALLVPAALSVFMPYSPIVILGQTYLGKNAGFASGVTLGLSTTLGGIFAPLVGWAADMWGLPAALQILWMAGLLGAVVSFTLPAVKKEG